MGGFRNGLWRYASAVLATAAAAILRVGLNIVLQRHHPTAASYPYPTFFLAVLWTAFYCGLGPALLATALGGAIVSILISHPILGVRIISDFAGVVAYFVTSLTAVLLIVDRQRVQRALERAEAQLRLTQEYAPVGICRLSVDNYVLEVNSRMCEITGHSRAEFLGRHLRDLLVPEGVKPGEQQRFERFVRGATRFFSDERQIRRGDGTIIWVNLIVSRVPGRAGALDYLILILQDINEQKQAAERLRSLQKLESIGLLAGGIAHDFNNLMTAILGFATLAKDRAAPEDPVRRDLDVIIGAAEKGANLTSQLLAYAGKGQFVPALVDISELVRKTETLLRPSLRGGVNLRFDLADELPRVLADPRQMQQLIANLVINSAEAVGEGKNGSVVVRTGLRSFVGQYSLEPAVGQLAPGEYVMLEVQDDGDGMDAVTMGRIFDPFFSTKFTGRGLGLAAVSGIVRSLGGAIFVSSAVGGGTTVTVLLPPAAARQAEPEAKKAA